MHLALAMQKAKEQSENLGDNLRVWVARVPYKGWNTVQTYDVGWIPKGSPVGYYNQGNWFDLN